MNIITPEPRSFAVVGGDLRQVCLARLLARDRHRVYTYGSERREHGGEDAGIHEVGAASELPRGCVVILPLPAEDGEYVTSPLSSRHILTEELLDTLERGTLVCAGRASKALRAACERRGLTFADYFEREELTVMNALATAEAAAALAAENLPIMLREARALVVGFGRIGKLLTLELKGLGCRVSASARRYEDLAWAEAFGAHAVRTSAIGGIVQDYDVIFNTVPAQVLGRNALERMRGETLVIDLASKPGGVDWAAAKELGTNVIWALSLPGKASPVTAGRIIRDSIYNILGDGGV